jgi:hypothetical protein
MHDTLTCLLLDTELELLNSTHLQAIIMRSLTRAQYFSL